MNIPYFTQLLISTLARQHIRTNLMPAKSWFLMCHMWLLSLGYTEFKNSLPYPWTSSPIEAEFAKRFAESTIYFCVYAYQPSTNPKLISFWDFHFSLGPIAIAIFKTMQNK
jgi:hypothetical protein